MEKNIYQRLFEFKKSVPTISKDSAVKVRTKTGGEYKYNFASLCYIQEIIDSLLQEQGLGYIQKSTPDSINTIIYSIDGEEIDCGHFYVAKKDAMQERGGDTTMARRYALVGALALVLKEEDDDASKSSGIDATITSNNYNQQPKQFSTENKIDVWLSQEQHDQLINMQDLEKIQKALEMKTTKDGKSFGMKKQFRESLQNCLK